MADARFECTLRRGWPCSVQALVLAFVPILCLACDRATAGEYPVYLIKFDEVGYDNVPGDVQNPPEKLFFFPSGPDDLG